MMVMMVMVVGRFNERTNGKLTKCESIYGIQTLITNYSVEWTYLGVKMNSFAFFLFPIRRFLYPVRLFIRLATFFWLGHCVNFIFRYSFRVVFLQSIPFFSFSSSFLKILKIDLLVILYADVWRFVKIDCSCRLRQFFFLSSPIIRALGQLGCSLRVVHLFFPLVHHGHHSTYTHTHKHKHEKPGEAHAFYAANEWILITFYETINCPWYESRTFQISKASSQIFFSFLVRLFIHSFFCYYFSLPFYSMVRSFMRCLHLVLYSSISKQSESFWRNRVAFFISLYVLCFLLDVYIEL